MYFLVNASLPKMLDVATSNFAAAYKCRSHDVDGTGQCLCDLRSRSNTAFSCKCISLTFGHSNFKLCRCIGHMM